MPAAIAARFAFVRFVYVVIIIAPVWLMDRDTLGRISGERQRPAFSNCHAPPISPERQLDQVLPDAAQVAAGVVDVFAAAVAC